MGVASLVIGIISLLLAIVPCCAPIAWVPALVGLGLGIAGVVTNQKNLGKLEPVSLAGAICSGVAVIVCIVWLVSMMSQPNWTINKSLNSVPGGFQMPFGTQSPSTPSVPGGSGARGTGFPGGSGGQSPSNLTSPQMQPMEPVSDTDNANAAVPGNIKRIPVAPTVNPSPEADESAPIPVKKAPGPGSGNP